MCKRTRLISLLSFLLTLTLFCPLFSGCAKISEKNLQTCQFFGYFDTVSSLKFYESDGDKINSVKEKFEALLIDYDKLLDVYEHHDNTVNLYDVNNNAGKEAMKVDQRLFDVIEFGKQMHELTEGACNVALGAVISLWHDAREYSLKNPDNAYLPSDSDIKEALLHTDINSLILNKEDLSVKITDEKLSLDFGAVAKGFIAQKASELLNSLGYKSFLVNLGGNVLATGEKSDGSAWKALIEDPFPDKRNGFTDTISLIDQTLVTSGSYQRFYTVEGKNYSHIINNTDGMPPDHFASVSVIAPSSSSGIADALSTALFCMDLESGKKLIESLDGIEAIWISDDGSIFQSAE